MITKSTTINAPDPRVRVGLRFAVAAVGLLAIIGVALLVADRYLDLPLMGDTETPVTGNPAIDQSHDYALRHSGDTSVARWERSEDYGLRHVGEPYAPEGQSAALGSSDRLVDYALRHMND